MKINILNSNKDNKIKKILFNNRVTRVHVKKKIPYFH